MKLKSVRYQNVEADSGKRRRGTRKVAPVRIGQERPQRAWSLLLPPSYFSERR